jgi:hypothetical protein
MAGSKSVVARELWQTMEHSMGVMLRLRKVWWLLLVSMVRLRRSAAQERSEAWFWGRRVWRIGWRKVEYRFRGMWIRAKVPSWMGRG